MTNFDLNTLPARFEHIDNSIEDIRVAVATIGNRVDDVWQEFEDGLKPDNDKLFAALSKAQGEIQNAKHDAEANAGQYSYKYATLDAVLEAVRGPLSKNGLSIMQLPGRKLENDGKTEVLTLTTILGHSSGQSIQNYFEMYPPKRDPQGIGSAMTYMRRYTIMAICGIAGAADDDAGAATGDGSDYERISAAEVDQILELADDLFGDDADGMVERMCDKLYGVAALRDVPAGEAELAMRRLENQKKKRGTAQPADEPADKKPEAEEKPASKPSMTGK